MGDRYKGAVAMDKYLQDVNAFLAAIYELPDKLAGVLAMMQAPIRGLTNTLIVTNVLLGCLVITSLANVYMLWRQAKKNK